jgi:hypothetical protein
VWVAYPALHVAFQLGDITSLLTNKTVGAELVGASTLGARARARGAGDWIARARAAPRAVAAHRSVGRDSVPPNPAALPLRPPPPENPERSTIVLGKVLHYALLLLLPYAAHGSAAAVAAGAAGYSITLSIILATVFFVSHNVPQSKPLPAGPDTKAVLFQEVAERDWGVQQVGRGLGVGGGGGLGAAGRARLPRGCRARSAAPGDAFEGRPVRLCVRAG